MAASSRHGRHILREHREGWIIDKHLKHREKIVEGPILPAIWHVALPMMVSMGLQSLFNLVDIYFVGKLSAQAVAAVGMSGIVMFVMMTFIIGLGTATRALIARFVGSRDMDKASETAFASLTIALGLSVLVAFFGTFLAPQILELLGAEGEVLVLGVKYIRIMFIGVMGLTFSISVNSILQGAGDARTPMIILLFSTGLNIILDPMLIMGYGPFPKLGVEGAAIATVCARGMAMAIGLIVLFFGKSGFKLSIKDFSWRPERIGQIFRIGLPAATQPLIRNLSGLVLIRIVTGFGTASVAAYVIVMRIMMFVLMPGIGLGDANGTVVAQNLGAGKIDRAKKAIRLTASINATILIPMGIILAIFAGWVISKFNAEPDVVAIGARSLRIFCIGIPFIAIGTVLTRAINGAGKTVIPAIMIAIALLVVKIPLAVVLSGTYLETGGVFIAFVASDFTLAAISIWYFLSGRWALKRIR
jgi:putative MATE family efflux protein